MTRNPSRRFQHSTRWILFQGERFLSPESPILVFIKLSPFLFDKSTIERDAQKENDFPHEKLIVASQLLLKLKDKTKSSSDWTLSLSINNYEMFLSSEKHENLFMSFHLDRGKSFRRPNTKFIRKSCFSTGDFLRLNSQLSRNKAKRISAVQTDFSLNLTTNPNEIQRETNFD